MNTSNHASFAGLPAPLVKDILARTAQIADGLYGPFTGIRSRRSELRQRLIDAGHCNRTVSTGDARIMSACGIDAYHSFIDFPSAGLILATALTVEGSVPPGAASHWDMPHHSIRYLPEKQYAGTAQLLHGIAMQLVTEQAAGAPHELILITGSLIKPFITVMDSLHPAMAANKSAAATAFIQGLKPALAGFRAMFGAGNGGICAGVARNTANTEMTRLLELPADTRDTALFTILLEPGEHTTPVPLDLPELGRIEQLPVKDAAFAGILEELTSLARGIRVLYYRPHAWAPALRIEVCGAVADDTETLARLLDSIHYQCKTPGMALPYPVARANAMVRDLAAAAPALRQALITQITNVHKQDLGELFALLMFQS